MTYLAIITPDCPINPIGKFNPAPTRHGLYPAGGLAMASLVQSGCAFQSGNLFNLAAGTSTT
jgi:hypothetical protein